MYLHTRNMGIGELAILSELWTSELRNYQANVDEFLQSISGGVHDHHDAPIWRIFNWPLSDMYFFS